MVTIFQGKIQGVGHDDMLAAKLAGYVEQARIRRQEIAVSFA
jgi:ribosomal protein L27